MGTVYPAIPYAAHHPLGDVTQTHDVYPPTPGMNHMHQNPDAMNPYGTLPQGSWEQWWSPEDTGFPGPSHMATSDVYAQEEPQYNTSYTYDPEPSVQWDSPATSIQSCAVPSPSTDPTSVDVPNRGSESRRVSSAAEPEKRKRKRATNQNATAKSTRRGSTKKAIKVETPAEKPKVRSRAKPAPQLDDVVSPEPDEGQDDYNKKIQERNRIASNKFRVKKREDAKKLRANEEDMERVNRDLSSCVSDLTLQVYELKMRLLQHTDCECRLIQDYIANEAHRYIHDLGEGNETLATPPLHPFHHPK